MNKLLNWILHLTATGMLIVGEFFGIEGASRVAHFYFWGYCPLALFSIWGHALHRKECMENGTYKEKFLSNYKKRNPIESALSHIHSFINICILAWVGWAGAAALYFVTLICFHVHGHIIGDDYDEYQKELEKKIITERDDYLRKHGFLGGEQDAT